MYIFARYCSKLLLFEFRLVVDIAYCVCTVLTSNATSTGDRYKMNKAQVITAWANGRYGRTGNGSLTASLDGTLRSYNLVIGKRTSNGLIVGDFTASGSFYSMTTSHHVGNARRVAPVVSVDQFNA